MGRIRAEYPYNTMLRRVCVGFADGVVFLPLTILRHVVEKSESRTVVTAGAFLYYLCVWAYEVWMHGRYGATLGKKFFYLRVTDVSGKPLTMKQALLRNSIHIGATVLVLGLYTAGILLGLPPEDIRDFPPRGPAPPAYVWVKWIIGSVVLAWFVADTAAAVINKRRRAIHDLLAGTVVIRYP
jgi:uncharacterized RDD family membrane protein YckC